MRNMADDQIPIARPASVKADIAAGVTIGTVFNGYFNSPEAADAFNLLGISPLLARLSPTARIADFGGGDGYLIASVCAYLRENGLRPAGMVIDMNPLSLNRVRDRGYAAVAANLEDVDPGPLDLAIARAVLHYNPLSVQRRILTNIQRRLKPGGYFVHSISSGEAANCVLRTAIAALPSLGRTNREGIVCFVTPKQYEQMAQAAGFAETSLVGYAPDNSWKLSDMFERFNPRPQRPDPAYDMQRMCFMRDAQTLVKKYAADTGLTGTILYENDARVRYHYPIFISRKAA